MTMQAWPLVLQPVANRSCTPKLSNELRQSDIVGGKFVEADEGKHGGRSETPCSCRAKLGELANVQIVFD